MVKRHLSMLNVPMSWPVQRKKGVKWIARPNPGAHALENCMTLNIILKNILKYAKTKSEAKKILDEGKVLVNNKARKDQKFSVGIMDVLEIPTIKEHYRVLYTPKGMFTLHKISGEEAKLKPAKITGKKILKGNKIQLNFNDGRNMIVSKDEFKVNDTLIFSMGEKWGIKKHVKFEKGALVYIMEGTHKGMSGIIENIKEVFSNPTIEVKSKDKTFETSKNFAFVIDDSISLGEGK